MKWAADKKGRCLEVDFEWAAYTGLCSERAAGERWRKAVHPDDLAYITHIGARAREAGIGYDTRYRLRDADGRFRWVINQATPILGRSGRPTGYEGGLILAATDDAARQARTTDLADRLLEARAIAQEIGDRRIVASIDEALIEVGFRLARGRGRIH